MASDEKRVYERVLLGNLCCDNSACHGITILKRMIEKDCAFRRIVVLKCFDCGKWLATINDDLEATPVKKWKTKKPLSIIEGLAVEEGEVNEAKTA